MRYILKKICLGFIFCLIGCNAPTTPLQQFTVHDKIKVLSTIEMIDDVVAQIGGDQIEHLCLISKQMDPHSYELVKGDDEKIIDADLVLYSGANLEHGASLCCKIKKHPNALSVGDYVRSHFPELILSSQGTTDPHLWMDISIWYHIIDPIVDSLSELSPNQANYFLENGNQLKQKMLETHQKIYSMLQSIPESKRYLVTSHDAFGYFTKAYLATEEERSNGDWKKRFAAPEGLAPDGQLSILDIYEIIDHLCKYDIHVVFAESNVSCESLKKIISASTEKAHEVHFSHKTLYADAMEGGVSSYLEMIEKNALSLMQEWMNDD